MAHELSNVNGRFECAYAAGQPAPWHAGVTDPEYFDASTADGATVARASGIEWEIMASPVMYRGPEGYLTDETLKMQFRSDNGAPLGVVGAAFQTTQPKNGFDTMQRIVDATGAQWDAAFSLFGGRKLVFQAKLPAAGIQVKDGDVSHSYVTFAYACDGTMPRSIWFSEVRAVCNNMLRYSFGAAQKDKMSRLFRQSHKTEFNPDAIVDAIGIIEEARAEQLTVLQAMARVELESKDSQELLARILGKPSIQNRDKGDDGAPKISKPEQEILRLYAGDARGADMAGQTAYGLLNAVTEYTDHHYGRSADARINSMLMGPNAQLKDKAFSVLAEHTRECTGSDLLRSLLAK